MKIEKKYINKEVAGWVNIKDECICGTACDLRTD